MKNNNGSKRRQKKKIQNKRRKDCHDAELRVLQELLGLGDAYHVFGNVLLDKGGMTTEIDAIVVSVYGVFVIEMKHYAGVIQGMPSSYNWAQFTQKGSHRIYNPRLQNRAHVKTILELFDISPSIVHSRIVFTNRLASINAVKSNEVIDFSNVTASIKKETIEVLSDEDVEIICERIGALNIDSKENRVTHLNNIKRMSAIV